MCAVYTCTCSRTQLHTGAPVNAEHYINKLERKRRAKSKFLDMSPQEVVLSVNDVLYTYMNMCSMKQDTPPRWGPCECRALH